ncbi:uncharacterized protein LAJ45_06943 [Morchella importuna]|uniref:uncharacterized protein n=1 Tax=Morchella importuna TaxID=1174673 RepID=UPI001E8DA5CF|nr:uncharacterized protein LAJ45_06943 [Morchella importuna]KAH8148968.1 hypothetical protein LAJ45_06943 [Morchella importuna]
MSSPITVQSHLYVDSPPTICVLEIAPHFASLTPKQKLYAHHISHAAYLGTRVCARQCSPESEHICDLILSLHKAVSGDYKKLSSATGVSDENVKYFLEYAAMVLTSCGNYKSFGDAKFIPRIPEEELAKLAEYDADAKASFEKVKEAIYATQPEARNFLGYPDAGHVSTYYPDSPDITKAEIEAVQDFMNENSLLSENTRLRKVSDTEFHLLIASAHANDNKEFTLPDGKKLKLEYGDHAAEMKKIAAACKDASESAENEVQKNMWLEYARSFADGSIEAHKESQKLWVQDQGPVVESNIGFIETYRDPHGVRGEWEGFVAVVNQEQTKKFGELVRRAEEFIKRLPWGIDFEKDTFIKPDFTSLEVLSFAGGSIPAGINIPNYDDIRQNIGFKNVSLANVLNAKAPSEKITFLSGVDLPLYERLRGKAFEVQVGVHELLGHGTGKLLQETSKGVFNFPHDSPPVSPVTGKPISTWYKPGETWGGVFGGVAGSYEECRAECVAMVLGVDKDILSIFGHADEDAEDVLYIEYLQMARAGLLALEMWDPKTSKWGQPHMQARYSILQCFRSAGDGFVSFEHSRPDKSDLVVKIDRTKILSHGVPAVSEYLTKLHVYKSTADVKAGTKLYAEMTTVSEEMKSYRDVVMSMKQPRKMFVQANTVMGEDGTVELREYEATPEGVVKSFADREL